jgi:hypothetical protein
MVTGMVWIFYVPKEYQAADISFVASKDSFKTSDLILEHKKFER